ncbi:MAG: DUF2141 domain-containing protein [Cyclobacteriaceae bacterium]|nr:DUF2141 domain-containing protein [Cyclobacteriaceae bacterium]
MKKFVSILAGGICFLLISCFCKAQTGTLNIEATNFKSDTGVAIVHLFREHDDLPRKPFMKATAKITNGKATIAFPNILFGDYAAILFQDENSNGILDHKFGLPNEPMGFSNQWKLSLFSGMPSFKKLKFRFEGGAYFITI